MNAQNSLLFLHPLSDLLMPCMNLSDLLAYSENMFKCSHPQTAARMVERATQTNF